jgi:hypothetical protein
MKLFVSVLMSLVVLTGCENPFDFPTGNNMKFPTISYANRIVVKTNDGNPCINAVAKIQDREYYADTLGIIHGTYWTDDESLPTRIERPVRIYKNKSDASTFWQGMMPFKNTDGWASFGSDLTSPPSEPSYPITEVIFPE